jgi:hypothetical protein
LLGATERDGPVVAHRLERTEDLESHPRNVRPAAALGKVRPAGKARPRSRNVHRPQPLRVSL